MTIPVTVFTGFLGAGKTSIILSLLPQLPKDYRVVLLKNEFGEIEGCHIPIVLLSSADTDPSRQSISKAEQLDRCERDLERMHVRAFLLWRARLSLTRRSGPGAAC